MVAQFLNVICDAVAVLSPVIVPRTPSFRPRASVPHEPPTNWVEAVSVTVCSLIRIWSAGHTVPKTKPVTTPSPSTSGVVGVVVVRSVMLDAVTLPSAFAEPFTATVTPAVRLVQLPPEYCVEAST